MQLKKFFSDTGNVLAFAIGLIPAIIFYIFPSKTPIDFHLFAILLMAFLISLWVCIKLFLDIKEKDLSLKDLQQQLQNIQAPSFLEIVECFHDVCICKPNNLLSQDSLVAFCQRIRGFETAIGFGYVEIINSSGLAQIKEIYHVAEISNLMQHINDHRDNIVIRTTINWHEAQKVM